MLVNGQQRARLSDFGTVNVLTHPTATSRNMKGTLRWMSPEIVNGGRYTRQSDLWAFAWTVIEVGPTPVMEPAIDSFLPP